MISRTTKHSGAIKALQFNPKHPNLLATSGAKGEVRSDSRTLGVVFLLKVSDSYSFGT